MLIVRFASRVVPACGASLLVALLGCATPAAADSQRAQPARSASSTPGTELGTFVVLVTAGAAAPDPARVSVDWSRLDPAPASGTATGGANGLWRTDQLPYGKYELTVRYADGVPRTSRVVLDEPRERVDVAMPYDRIVIRTDRPVHELSVRCVSLWQGTAVRAWTDTTEAQLAAEGLALGQYIVHAIYDKGGMIVEHVRLTDAQADVVLDLHPVPPGEVQLALTGWSGPWTTSLE